MGAGREAELPFCTRLPSFAPYPGELAEGPGPPGPEERSGVVGERVKGSGFKGALAGRSLPPAPPSVPEHPKRAERAPAPRDPGPPARRPTAAQLPLPRFPRSARGLSGEPGGGRPEVGPYPRASKRDLRRPQPPPRKIGPFSRPRATVALQSRPAPPRPRPSRRTPPGQHGWCRLCHVKGWRGGATAPGNRRGECGTRRNAAGIGH